ncbi:ATP-binding protein [Enterococcus faecium]|uniref:ATP-binding protein n=1 Tax=Enterococcus faecium TaxID=1352 RepID=UPI00035426EA|nr:ATP-binding protein [Enterococcus faecium]EGP4752008.1 ATPase [Enterococcus faecium]EME3511378.1 ATP-binding protein [Enterococcus faecium]EME7093482.1 ATP-binding protein [Enterococcus faecium]EMF0346635.1 ATP-binding protein [Enterococcus faecium]EPI22400.1 hypothetical protein D352_01619 [Enterococcus faecium LA4B-2]
MITVESPLKALKDHLMLNNEGDIWGYYEVTPKTISQNNPKAMQDNKEMMASLLNLLRTYEDIDLTMYPRTLNLRSRFDKLAEGFDPESREIGEYYANETIHVLEQELGNVYRPSFLLGVKIKDAYIAEDVKELAKKMSDVVVQEVISLLGYELADPSALFEQVKLSEQELTQILFSYSIRPLSKNEMIYANRMQYIRGMKHKIEDENCITNVQNIQSSVLSPLKKGKGILKIEDELGESYVSFLPVGKFPDNMKNINLFQFVQDLRFPVELRVKLHYPEIKGVNGVSTKLGWLTNRFKEEQQVQEAEGGEASSRTKSIRFLASALREKLEQNQPVMDWLACLVVYGQTREEVRERSLQIIKSLDDVIKVYKGKKDQFSLFYKMAMGQALGTQKHWVQRTTCEAVAELLFATIEELGMSSGNYIGRLDVLGTEGSRGEKTPLEEFIYASNKYVFLNPLAIAEGITGALYDAPHIAVTGKTGKGKSFLVGLLFLYSSFLDVQSLFVDPKGEKRKWFKKVIHDPYYKENYPLFVKHLDSFNYVTLDASKKSNYGVLDPMIYLDRNNAKQVAQDMIDELSPLKNNFLLKGAVLSSIEQVLNQRDQHETVGLMNVIDLLRSHENKNVKEYGDFLYLTINDSILRLGFSYGENAGLSFQEKVTILEIQDLKLPKDGLDPSLYSDADRKSLCLMISLGRFCEMFGKRDISYKTAIYFTEAWVFNKSNSGRAIISAMARVGRSQMNQLVLDTQFIDDLGSDDEKGNFGVVFAFDEDSEREKILHHLGLEVNDKNLKEMKRMIKGQCWMRDPYGRFGKLNVHCPFEEMAAALKTTEKTSNSEAEEQVA